MKKWYKTRIAHWVFYTVLYAVLWKVTEFEFTTVVAFTQIMAETVYGNEN